MKARVSMPVFLLKKRRLRRNLGLFYYLGLLQERKEKSVLPMLDRIRINGFKYQGDLD